MSSGDKILIMTDPSNAPVLIGDSPKIRSVLRILEKIVPTDSAVLILGESGTGKELVARYIHEHSGRCTKPLVSVNCSAFNETLLESELFGYCKGAFTGATKDEPGLFRQAHEGTLFLDEVADMSFEMQKRLLRVIEEGEVRPIGSRESYRADVRIIAATNKNIKRLAQESKFREDLYFRLHVITLRLPSLRERKNDIPLLIEFYSERICQELQRPVVKLPEETLRLFMEYDWPGNVRELVNELRRVIILQSQYSFDGFTPEPHAIEDEEVQEEGTRLVSMEKQTILKALDKCGGNKSKAATLLGIARRTLYQKLKRHNLD